MKKIMVCVLFTFCAAAAFAEERYALVIGNSAYKTVSRLSNPANDAADMGKTLQGLGFTVDLLTNASLEQMDDAAIRFKRNLSRDTKNYGFFFYAGHAVEVQGQNYLIPVDADIKSEANVKQRAYNVQVLLGELEEAGNSLNMIVLDACRDNPFGWSRSGSRGLAVVSAAPAGTIVVYATSAGKTAADGTGRNGLFTSQLLKNLPAQGVEVKEVFNRTGSDVLAVSGGEQFPELSIKFFGQAYLNGTGGNTPYSPPPIVPPPEGFVRIEGGTFTMGSPSSETDRSDDEAQHRVTVSAFYMGQYEVTQAEYEAVIGTNPSHFKGAQLPVEMVSWYDAVEYCNKRSEQEDLTPAYSINKFSSDPNNRNSDDTVSWTVTWNKGANGYRLPTETEWEYACRALARTPFNTGNNITTSQANYDGNYPYANNPKGTYRQRTTNVGSFASNSWGLFDMHGNVYEWCWDWYGDSYWGYSMADQTDPSGPAFGSYRICRGGGWRSGAESLWSGDRYIITSSVRIDDRGFRVVRNAR